MLDQQIIKCWINIFFPIPHALSLNVWGDLFLVYVADFSSKPWWGDLFLVYLADFFPNLDGVTFF